MKLSFDWLSDFVDLSGLSAQELADKLTMGAFEVEEVLSFGPDIQGPLVVGEILEINPHPNADKIRLTKIRLADSGDAQEIVCGAWNIEVGHKIPVALPGAKVINRHDGSPLHIKENKIRGVTSNGMLCSAPELGIAGSGEGIMILPPSTKIGINAKDLLGLKNDYVLHVEPRSNRGDALSVLGLAREVAALFARPLKKESWLDEFAIFNENAEFPHLSVEIEDSEDCPFFTIRTLCGITIKASDQMISRRLEAIGVKSISNVVDITNYVLHELGQPLHAYDLDKLTGLRLSARRGREGQRLTTIDQKERVVGSEVLVIADRDNLVGVAGVMGGKDSEVTDSSTNIALEAASFNSARVRRSSRLLGLSSESSLRFERGVDRAGVEHASNRASYLLQKYCGAKLGKLAKAGSAEVPEKRIELRMSELKRICEIELNPEEAASMLLPLGFKSSALSEPDAKAEFVIPSFRQRDVCREIDLIEEICRLWGYERLPVSMPASTVAARTSDQLPRKIRQTLCSLGLNEAWISSLTSYDDLDARKSITLDKDSIVGVLNPLSAEHQVLRQSLIPGLIKAASYNQDRANANPYLFELGKVYRRDSRRINKQLPAERQTGTHEELMIGAITCGEPKLSLWSENTKLPEDGRSYYLIKGMFENLLSSLNIQRTLVSYDAGADIPGCYHPGRSAACRIDLTEMDAQASDKNGNKKKKSKTILLGFIGELHPAVADAYKLNSRAGLMELSLAALAEAMNSPRFQELYMTPISQRDLTCDLPNSTTQQEVENTIKSLKEETLKKLELVSIFQLSEQQKSLSYRLSFQHPSQTLTSEAVDAVMSQIRETLSSKLNASFRV